MYKTKKIRILIYLTLFFLGFTTLHARWGPDKRLTYDPASKEKCRNNAWGVAANEGTVHIVWGDRRHNANASEIYYKRSTNNGLSWESDFRLTYTDISDVTPAIAVSGSNIHVVWFGRELYNFKIYYKRSTNNGTTWLSATNLASVTDLFHKYPSVAVTGEHINVAWQDIPNGNWDIYYRHGMGNGQVQVWTPKISLQASPFDEILPSVATSGSSVHVVWRSDQFNSEIWYRKAINNGASWPFLPMRLTNNADSSDCPSIAVSGSNIHVVWQDKRDGNWEIYYKRSTNNGTTWGSDTRLTSNSALSSSPSIAVLGLEIHVVWHDERDGNRAIYYKQSQDNGSIWKPDTRLTYHSAKSWMPNIAAISDPSKRLHVVWLDERDGNWEIYYKKWQNFYADPTDGVEDANSASSFAILHVPTLFKSNISIKFASTTTGPVEIALYNIYGNSVFKKTISYTLSSLTLKDERIEKLIPGIYFLQIYHKNKELGRFKLVKL